MCYDDIIADDAFVLLNALINPYLKVFSLLLYTVEIENSTCQMELFK